MCACAHLKNTEKHKSADLPNYRNVQIVKSKVLLEPGKDESGIKGPQRCTSRNQCIVGVGDASLRMHRLHDGLQFFETSLKNHIVKN